MPVIITESMKLAAGAALFTRSFLRGVYENYIKYESEKNKDYGAKLEGIGLNPKKDVLPSKLPSAVEVCFLVLYHVYMDIKTYRPTHHTKVLCMHCLFF